MDSRFAWSTLFLLSVLLAAGCSSSKLEPWHTAHLEQEFEADDLGEMRTFDDYLALEERLFRELDETVYAQVATGPEYAILRYSRGSASDPESFAVNYNRSFELEAGDARGAVLLIHGMSDSPYSLAAIGKRLNEDGYHVLGLRLPGHGTVPASLTRTHWQDMAAAVQLAMRHLADEVAPYPVHIVGYSNGAALALNHTLEALDAPQRVVPGSLVLVSPAVAITPVAALAGTQATIGRIPGLRRLAYTAVLPEFDPYRYNSFPTNGGTQTRKLTRRVSSLLSDLTSAGRGNEMPPVLVIKSTVDSTVSNDAIIDALLAKLPDNGHELLVFDINRLAAATSVLVAQPAPFTARLIDEPPQPFAITFVSNWTTGTEAVIALRRAALDQEVSSERPLAEAWPQGVISMSHIAVPIPPDDPLYGRYRPSDRNKLFLGAQSLRGERGLLQIPDNWFTRQRYNPFFGYTYERIRSWIDSEE